MEKPEHVTENVVAGEIVLSIEVINRIEEIMVNEPEYHPIYGNINYRNYKNGEI